MKKLNRKCLECEKDISHRHLNTKYCSLKCYDKFRYKRDGYRYTEEQRKEWYKQRKKKKGYIQKLRDKGNARVKIVRDFIADYKIKNGCKDCGYKKHQCALDFDHVKGKKMLNVCFSKSINQAKLEIKKCEVVCSNCHRIRTYKRLHPCKPDIFEATYEKV